MPSRLRKIRALTVKTLRVTTYLSIVAVGLGAVGTRAVQAKGEKVALALGEPLSALDGVGGGGTVLMLNGTPVHLASAELAAPLATVLDRAEKGCETHAAGLADDFADLESSFGRAPSERGFPGVAVLRDVREGHGVVACFAPDAPTGPMGLMKRLGRFAQSEDLGDVGGLRYMTAYSEGGGTRVTATWADGRIDIGAMFPSEGDAPGEDPSAAPRPDGARRIVSARVMPAPYGAYVYATKETAERAITGYERAVVARGFEVVSSDPTARAYRRGLVDVMVTASSTQEGATLSIIESHFAQAKAQGN
jgi:hypothetical protein